VKAHLSFFSNGSRFVVIVEGRESAWYTNTALSFSFSRSDFGLPSVALVHFVAVEMMMVAVVVVMGLDSAYVQFRSE
jgi:hypothetical protein